MEIQEIFVQVQGYQIDYEDWHHDVHGALPYHNLIHKDPELRQILKSLPYPKLIFTNADIKHAETVLRILGIGDLFEVRLPKLVSLMETTQILHMDFKARQPFMHGNLLGTL